MSNTLAPLVLFVYARPEHTHKTLQALATNAGASRSDLIVYSDGPRSPLDAAAVAQVRSIVRASAGFKSVRLIERSENWGLARSIISGLNEVFTVHESAIVLEDDIECAPQFIQFMNAALLHYQGDERIWHVNAWNYPIPVDGLPSVYCVPTMNCWGWATWRGRWQRFNPDPAFFMKRRSIKMRYRFNLDGSYPFYSHLLSNYLGRRRTWAIFWYATIFDAGGLCIQPARTLTNEIGSDGSGTHGLKNDMYLVKELDSASVSVLNVIIEENTLARARVIDFNRMHFGRLTRLVNIVRMMQPFFFYSIWKRARDHVRVY